MAVVIRKSLTLFLTLVAVMAVAADTELILDMYGIGGHRLLTGLAGTLLVIMSLLYSMRKRKKGFIKGKTKGWLKAHEWLAMAGTVVILIHVGTHLKAVVPVIALVFMLTAFVSGLVGRYLYDGAREEIRRKRERLAKEGASKAEIEETLSTLAATSEALGRWRVVHMPIVAMLSLMTIYHAVSALYFGGM